MDRAGDSFIGAFVAQIIDETPLFEAISYANTVASITVTRPGALISIPSADEVRKSYREIVLLE